MKRLLLLILVVTSLALPAGAFATIQVTKTHIGAKYAAKSVSGDCSVSRSKLLGTATLNCTSDNGSAAVRYDFAMPSTCGPSFKWYVNASGNRSVTASRSATTVHVLVHSSGRGVVVVSLVSIYYYC
jgi:hypothetical protein